MVNTVMYKWQAKIKETDISLVDIPVSIGFLASGQVKIAYSLSQSIEVFHSFEDAMDWINEYLKSKERN